MKRTIGAMNPNNNAIINVNNLLAESFSSVNAKIA
jgi:hypothetical protein